MNYLVLRKRGEQSTLSLVSEGTHLDRPFDSWSLDTGEKILWVNNNMHKVLRSHYMMGAYVDRAIYGYTYEEMKAILHSKLGLTEEENYYAVRDSVAPVSKIYPETIMYGFVQFLALCVHTLLKGFKFLMFMALAAIAAVFLSRKK